MMRVSRRVAPSPWRFLFWVVGVALGIVVVVGAFAAVSMVRIANDLSRARSMIASASADIRNGKLGTARSSLVQAENILIKANGQLYGKTEFDLISWAPIVDQNLTSLQRSVAVALEMVHGGNRLLDVTKPLENAQGKLEVSLDHGKVPLTVIERAQAEARDLAASLPGEGERPSGHLLVGPVADFQRTVFKEAVERRAQLDAVSRSLALLADMAGGNGPRRYLIAVANPAEMRGAGGMILSYGVLESNGGTFTLGNFGNIDELALDAPVDPASLKLPDDFLTRWTGLQPTLLWRNTTLAPDLRFDAPIMEAMFTAKTGLGVDGVIQIDPQGLAAILAGTGPIDVPTLGQVTADNVVDLTLNRAYVDFPERDQRQEVLGDVAKAAFDALVNGSFSSLRPFGEALFGAAQGRHLVFVADSQSVRTQTAFFGVDGALPDAATQDSLLLSIQNFSKNKLDYYVDSSLTVKGSRPVARAGDVSATITVANGLPAGVSSTYVTGPNAPGEEAGLYRGTVSLYVPTGTTLLDSTGAAGPVVVTSEAGRTVATYDVQLRPGESSTVTLHLSLVPRPPLPSYRMFVVPVPRVRPTAVEIDIDAGDGRRATIGPAPLVRPIAVAEQG